MADAEISAAGTPAQDRAGTARSDRSEQARVCVLSRAGCHLCEVAIAVVAEVCAATGDAFVVRDIDTDPELRQRYSDSVPVTFVDGAQHDFWRVDPDRLRRALGG